MMITENRRGDYHHILICGEVDAHEAAILGDVLRERIHAGDVRIILEFGRKVFVTSVAIGLLISLQRYVSACDGEIVLVRTSRMLQKSLGILGVTTLFRIEDSVGAAMREPALA
ncbi:MAG: STAS domain-containing protein [Planctomycetota bacterium]|jgi:anti-anti-sigma factor